MQAVITDEQAKAFLAARLRALLTERSMSQAELARGIDVSPMSVTFYIKGTKLASAGTVARMAEFFGVSADFLLSNPSGRKSRKTA